MRLSSALFGVGVISNFSPAQCEKVAPLADEVVKPLKGQEYLDSLPFMVSRAVPKTIFATDPPARHCDMALMDAISVSLGLPASALTDVLNGLLGGMMGASASLDTETINETYERILEAKGPANSAAPALFSIQQRLEAFAETFNTHTSRPEVMAALAKVFADKKDVEEDCNIDGASCDPSPFALGGPIDLKAIPDLIVGFLTSRVFANTVGELLGQNTPFVAKWDIESPMTNLGAAICKGGDSSFHQDFDPDWATCGIVTALAMALGCSETVITCNANASATVIPDLSLCDKFTPGTDPVDLTLKYDGRQNDLEFPKPEDEAEEGRVWLYHWMAVLAASSWSATQATCGYPPNPAQLIPGWERVFEVWSAQEGLKMHETGATDMVPQIVLSQKQGTGTDCEFHVTVRGTSTNYEWMINFAAQLVPIPESTPEVLGHLGYHQLSAGFMPALLHWLESERFTPGTCDYATTKFHVTGHSLGGGLSEVSVLKLAERYHPLGVEFNMVNFAPSHGLNQAGMDRLTAMVNIRSIVAELDLIPEFPCKNKRGLPHCDARTCQGIDGTGRDTPYGAHPNPIVFTKEHLGSYTYQRLNADGTPMVDTDGNPVMFDSAGTFNSKELLHFDPLATPPSIVLKMASPIQIGANHVCSYSCFLTAEFCYSDTAKAHMCECNSKMDDLVLM